jgi:hypothetical protein
VLKTPEIVQIELTVVILCFLPSCLDLNAALNHTPSALIQLNQPRLLQKPRRYRHRLLSGTFLPAMLPNGTAGLPPHITPTDGSRLNLIERWFELLRNNGGAHAPDKVEQALKAFTEALLATNPKRLSGRNLRRRSWPASR